MQIHVAQLTKQRLSDFFVKEDGHVAHKNALVAGAIVTGAVLGSLILAPEAVACSTQVMCDGAWCSKPPGCCWWTDPMTGHGKEVCC